MRNKVSSIYELADMAGVSPATVSRALNDDERISVKTRERIHDMAERFGYKKSSTAVNLSKGKTGVLAMLLPTIRNPVFAALGAKVIERGQESGYTVAMHFSELDKKREKEIVESFSKSTADGFIIVPDLLEMDEAMIRLLETIAESKPVVLRHNTPLGAGVKLDSVYVDFEKGAYDATKYLLELGRRRVKMLGSDIKLHAGGGKVDGFFRAMKEAGITAGKHDLIRVRPTLENAYKETLSNLKKDVPDAFVVQTDYLALGVLKALGELEIKVPDDVSIISMDNIEFGEFCQCGLTTMAQPVEEQAESLVDVVLARLNQNESPPFRIRFELTMIERESARAL